MLQRVTDKAQRFFALEGLLAVELVGPMKERLSGFVADGVPVSIHIWDNNIHTDNIKTFKIKGSQYKIQKKSLMIKAEVTNIEKKINWLGSKPF